MKTMKRQINIKRLELESWQRSIWEKSTPKDEIRSLGLRRVISIFNKAGWYYSRRTKFSPAFSWFENGKGEAYTKDNLVEGFEYDLKILNHKPLTDSMRQSLVLLKHEHILTKSLKELLRIDYEWKELRDIVRGGYKVWIRYNKFKKKIKNIT